ncbi:MAG TPA: TadE/TadG family type IV pilus assembly protein [Dongiaceae bacterium]
MRKRLIHTLRLGKHLLCSEEGVVAIEFGAVASVLILMAVGATDLGFGMRHRGQMESAVRAGVQKAMEGGTTDAVQSAVLASTNLPSDPAPTATATKKCYDDGGAEATCGSASAKSIYMEITLTQSHRWILGLPGWSNPVNLTLTRTVRIG